MCTRHMAQKNLLPNFSIIVSESNYLYIFLSLICKISVQMAFFLHLNYQ